MNQRKSLLIDLGSGGGGTPGRWGNPVRWGYQKSWGRIGVTSNSIVKTWCLLATFLFSPKGINIVQKKKQQQQQQQLNKSQMGII